MSQKTFIVVKLLQGTEVNEVINTLHPLSSTFTGHLDKAEAVLCDTCVDNPCSWFADEARECLKELT